MSLIKLTWPQYYELERLVRILEAVRSERLYQYGGVIGDLKKDSHIDWDSKGVGIEIPGELLNHGQEINSP